MQGPADGPCPVPPSRLHSPAQQSLTNGAKPSQSHLNELHHLPGLRDGDCQLLQLVLHIAEEFVFLGLWTRRTNAELCSPSPGGREAQGTLSVSKFNPQPLSDRDLAARLRVKGARGIVSWFPVLLPCNIQPSQPAGKLKEQPGCKGLCPAPRSPPRSQRKPNKKEIESKTIRQRVQPHALSA